MAAKRESCTIVSADANGHLIGLRGRIHPKPARIAGRSREISVWTVDLDQRPHVVADLSEILSDDEMETACRLRVEKDRTQFIVARAALRQILGRELQHAPASLRFAAHEHGKPYLPEHGDLQFNVSHSYGLCLIAVAGHVPVGVDLERVAGLEGLETLAREVLSPAEIEALRSSSDPLRLFYSCWTRKEAYVKALGGGWAIAVPKIETSLAGRPRFLRLPGDHTGSWSLIDFEPAPGYVAALAVHQTGASLRQREWKLTGIPDDQSCVSAPETSFPSQAHRAQPWS
jgi:4'-phosphopantetheinyl transferase